MTEQELKTDRQKWVEDFYKQQAEIERLQRDRQYHMDQINRLAATVGMLGETSETIINAAISNLCLHPNHERRLRDSNGDPLARYKRVAECRVAECSLVSGVGDHWIVDSE